MLTGVATGGGIVTLAVILTLGVGCRIVFALIEVVCMSRRWVTVALVVFLAVNGLVVAGDSAAHAIHNLSLIHI